MSRPDLPESVASLFQPPEIEVRPEWIDFNGHMNVGYYHVVFDEAATPFFAWLGLTPQYRADSQVSTFALESHLNFLREVKQGDRLRFTTRLLHHDARRIHFFSEMFHAGQGYLAATYESLSMHIDMRTRRTAPMAPALQQRLTEVMALHARAARPWQAGRSVGAPVPRT